MQRTKEELLAIGEYRPEEKLLKPTKVLATQPPLPPRKKDEPGKETPAKD